MQPRGDLARLLRPRSQARCPDPFRPSDRALIQRATRGRQRDFRRCELSAADTVRLRRSTGGRQEREDRDNALQARNKAANESDRFKRQTERLAKEILAAKEEIAKIEEDKRRSLDEQTFLKDFVKRVEANAKGLTEVLERIAAADLAAEAAAKAATEASKGKK